MLTLLESNPPVSKLTSPLSGGTREFFNTFYSLYTLPPLKGEVAQRAGGVVIKKREVVNEVNRMGLYNLIIFQKFEGSFSQ